MEGDVGGRSGWIGMERGYTYRLIHNFNLIYNGYTLTSIIVNLRLSFYR